MELHQESASDGRPHPGAFAVVFAEKVGVAMALEEELAAPASSPGEYAAHT
jgi:hypothetical protein